MAILQRQSVRYQQRHNLLAYMMYIYSILSLQCIIGRFSTLVAFGCFLSVERLCSRVLVYISRNKSKTGPESQFFSVWFIVWMIFWSNSLGDWSHWPDWMGMKTPCLGAHSGSLKKTLVAQTHNLGALGARAPVRQQPCDSLLLQLYWLDYGHYEEVLWQENCFW